MLCDAQLAQICMLMHQDQRLACVAMAYEKQRLNTGSGPLL